jgi:carbonic anhydrase
MDGKQVWAELLEGNRRFVRGERRAYDFASRRAELLAGQKCRVTVLTCSDSRVVPEFVFDVNLGELFDVETAGNVVDDVGLGTIEYGVEHLGTPLLLLLGHTRCGAVTACCREDGHAHGHLQSILDHIAPAAERTHRDIDEAILENLRQTRNEIVEKSDVVRRLAAAGRLEIVTALYRMETGVVERVE